MEELVYFRSTDGITQIISRKLLGAFKGSWFDTHFGPDVNPITLAPCDVDKNNHRFYMVNVPTDVLRAFVQLHSLPELFAHYAETKPDVCKYGTDLDAWQRYLAQYFSNQQTSSLKRAAFEEKADFSRPPKRFRRDLKEWEEQVAFLRWALESHPKGEDFLENAASASLNFVFPKEQTFVSGDRTVTVQRVLFAPAAARDDKHEARVRKSLERIIQSHYNVSLKVSKLEASAPASSLFAYPNYMDRASVWPVSGKGTMDIDASFIVLVFEWEDWDGK